MKKKMKAILFDFNGTMVFDAPYHDKAWKKFVWDMSGRELRDKELETHFHGNVNEKIIAYLFPDMSKEENTALSLKKESVYREMCLADGDNYVLVKGLPKFLDACKKQGIPMNIASASIKDNIAFFVEVFSLANWVDPNAICYDDGSYENKVQMFKDAAANLGVSTEECLVFEDSLSGIRCAKEAGAGQIIAIAPKEEQKRFEGIDGIDFVISDYMDERLKALW